MSKAADTTAGVSTRSQYSRTKPTRDRNVASGNLAQIAINGSDGPLGYIVMLLPLYWVSQHAVAAEAAGGVPLAVSYRTPEAVAEKTITPKTSCVSIRGILHTSERLIY